MKPVIRVVGLGPGDANLLTRRTFDLLRDAPIVRLRTRSHPAAGAFADATSYDDFYEKAATFEALYESIVRDLIELARNADAEVLYAVPGSPVVAERTVELLLANDEVTTILEPAVSIIDVACAALGRDPMASGLRIVDALANVEPLRGPGPLLVLQTYSSAVLASVADRVPPSTPVTVLHHVGLDDEVIVELPANELVSFGDVDHLTSLWIDGLRTAGEAMDDLVIFMRRLRAECPWDQEQTHASLTRHLLEEAYETLDALEAFVRVDDDDRSDEAAHVEEELGDLLFQIVFHAELGDEEQWFNLATIADGVRDKLTGRHPHVFGETNVSGSDEVAARWEVLKRDEKGRESVTDGIAWQLPALILYTKLLRKAALVELPRDAEASRATVLEAVGTLSLDREGADDAASSSDVDVTWGDAVTALVTMAQWAGVDLEGVLRERARQLRDEIRIVETTPPK